MANYYQKEDKSEFFRTPDWIVKKCYEMIPNSKTVLDPCAGDCGLEDFSKDIEYTLLDLYPRNTKIIQADFLKWTTTKYYDAAICNPPFGMKNEFVKHLFEFTDEIVLIAPLKSIINDWYSNIYDIYLDWKIPFFGFNILTSVAIFHLKKERHNLSKEEIRSKYLLGEVEGLNSVCIFTNKHTQDSYGIYLPITKANIVRNNELFRMEYIFEPGDDSIFVAKKASINNEVGDHLYRNLVYVNSKKEAEDIIRVYKENDEYIRNYAYQYGNNLLDIKYIPLLVDKSHFNIQQAGIQLPLF